MSADANTQGGLSGLLSGIFSGIGQSLSQQTQAAADQATQGFYVIAGELAVIIVILFGIFISQQRR